MNPFEKLKPLFGKFKPLEKVKLDPKAAEGIRNISESIQAINQSKAEMFRRTKAAAEAQIALPEQIERLNQQTGELLKIADAQKQLAEEAGKQAKNLSEQTDRLVQETIKLTGFTQGVYWLTIALVFFALVQIAPSVVQTIVMLFEYFSKNH
jgi:CTP-dependent riboflavin kinase